MEEWMWIAVGVGLLLLLVILIFVWRYRHRRSPLELMDGYQFEAYCAELLRGNGFEEVEVTPASGDFGVDVTAEKEGVTWAFQCKKYDHPVGVRAVQEIYSGRDYYHRMVGVVMTNSEYTKSARQLAEAHRIILWDGAKLKELAKQAAQRM